MAKDGEYFVVLYDRTEIAGLLGMSHADYGFEGITYNDRKQRFYLLIEARKHAKGCYKALIVEYDRDFKHVKDRPADFTFDSGNKGFEAIAHVGRESKDYLLALCEGNNCKGGRKGRTPGGRRIQVFEKSNKEVAPLLRHPPPGMSSVVVWRLCHKKPLWVGHFNEQKWAWTDEGSLYEFPRSADGSILYGKHRGCGVDLFCSCRNRF